MEGVGVGILGHFSHGIPISIVVGSTNSCSNELVVDEERSSILLDTVLNQKQGHHEYGRSFVAYTAGYHPVSEVNIQST